MRGMTCFSIAGDQQSKQQSRLINSLQRMPALEAVAIAMAPKSGCSREGELF
jgi:hypothetical protein